MRAINLSDHKQRDSHVAFEPVSPETTIRFGFATGEKASSVKVIKNTFKSNYSCLKQKAFEAMKEIEDLLIEEDPEIDFDYTGKISSRTKTIYLDSEENISYNLRSKEIVFDVKGQEVERRDQVSLPSNITIERPLFWTGKFVPLKKAVQLFVFSKVYQLRHVNGLTYDFLYGIAELLHGKQSVMLLGAGADGKEPLRFSRGGLPYRAFLWGRVTGDRYCLSLHLTNLELKDIE